MTAPLMFPAPGDRLVRHAGDRLNLRLVLEGGVPPGWRAFLRTNLTRAVRARDEVAALGGREQGGTFAQGSWRDIPLQEGLEGWELDLALTETGYFQAKAYALDPDGVQHWPEGPDLGISVLPDHLRTGNGVYCAFPRMFGPRRTRRRSEAESEAVRDLDAQGWAVIPPSGTLRDLTACVPHILDTLGCRILHLLPIGPVPTTFARMGRFGSPYAQLDMTAIDPALVVFDRRTTAEDQFRELASAVHHRGGLLFLDIVINHTGWGSRLMDQRPDGFKRNPDGTFHSPGAWGTTWEDLVELDADLPDLWKHIADSLLTWCCRGVDGFRCDAGYMVPVPVWQYVIARVRQSFPDTTFLLEGLGGGWHLTENLLTDGGMQWAYSELFQNHEPVQVSGYLDHALHQAQRMGPLVHYSETHDNARLAARGRTWSLMRNRLCALTSLSGTFGFTNGVEWLADEQIRVHGATGMAWGETPNLVSELAALNRLLREHPCFFDGAVLKRLSDSEAWGLLVSRVSATGEDRCLVVVNLDPDRPQVADLDMDTWRALGRPALDLLGQAPPVIREGDDRVALLLEPGASYCLSDRPVPAGLHGQAYRDRRAQAAWAMRHLSQAIPAEAIGPAPWEALARRVAADPFAFLASLPHLDPAAARMDLLAALEASAARDGFPPVVRWEVPDAQRVTVVPPDHWLLVTDESPFSLTLSREGRRSVHLRSIPMDGCHAAAIFPQHLDPGAEGGATAELGVETSRAGGRPVRSRLLLAPRVPRVAPLDLEGLVLLTNGRGAMARIHADLGRITSKYDCLLGVNLHPDSPCDRHILVKRLRAWASADGFLTPLDRHALVGLEQPEPGRAIWQFRVPAGDGRSVALSLEMSLIPGRNSLSLRLQRPVEGAPLALRLCLRLDLEDRGFHMETHGGDFEGRMIWDPAHQGFRFQAAGDRHLEVHCEGGRFHREPEWAWGIPHPVEGSRGMTDQGDAWSPGWFGIDLAEGGEALVRLSAEAPEVAWVPEAVLPDAPVPAGFKGSLVAACRAFLARRGRGLTVIAGYPWFLDWGRDTLIACRGLLEAGLESEVTDILMTYARFEEGGTLPNMLAAESLANRETSDAPLWFGLACEEAVARLGPAFLDERTAEGRRLGDVLASIARHHLEGTRSGVRIDPASGLVWSPSHHTWMDTNHPAGTPREGYPVELAALWIRMLRFLDRHGLAPKGDWDLRALEGLDRFWRPGDGFFSDCLWAPSGTSAREARPDGHLRPNMLFLVSLGLVEGERARATTLAALRWLLVPGALRSVAPLAVPEPLPIRAWDGRLLNDPTHPYWGHYEGDEDTRRKPAYHNGTAWVWPMPTLAEALVCAWPRSRRAVSTARSILGSLEGLLSTGCLGQLPEILDGDAPHHPRGCDAQAWSASEALRVWARLERIHLQDHP